MRASMGMTIPTIASPGARSSRAMPSSQNALVVHCRAGFSILSFGSSGLNARTNEVRHLLFSDILKG